MDWNSAWQIVLTAIASFGGAGVIIFAVSKWLARLTAEKILKRAEFEFSQKLEALKSELDKKNYISKVRFDLEIDIYRNLSGAALDMAEKCSFLPTCSIDKDHERPLHEREKKSIDEANAARNNVRKEIMRNAPFIPKEIYDIFFNMYEECASQCQLSLCFALGYKNSNSIKKDLKEFEERKKRIEQNKSILVERLREHIASLDVLDK